MNATTSFRGKIWKVWFSPELPFAVGPWKFAGVPGLILKAEDHSGIHSYEMIDIQQSTQIIPLYKWKMKEMSRDKWLEYEQKMHKNPYLFVDRNTLYISLEQIGDDRFLNESNWKNIPYYPLELE